MAQEINKMRNDLTGLLERANKDASFREKLVADPMKVLKENGMGEEAGKEFKFAEAMRPEGGCNDYTCIVTRCGPTCYVTVCFSTFRTLL